MMLTGMLSNAIAGRGFVIRRGTYTGEVDAAGLVWIVVKLSRRDPRDPEQERRIGLPTARFLYLEEAGASAPGNSRTAITEQIKAAEKVRLAREIANLGLQSAEEPDEDEDEDDDEIEPIEVPRAEKRKPGRPRKVSK